ncbi:MAG: metal-dependent transcriptional regulator [Lachnospiraceae bacterium]|nr:metal-dependent transcriptional regulator [Lachnospiraceae bacterium]
MKILESAENYLETILMLQEANGYVRSIDVANKLNFSKPSVSVAMKNLRENGYITVENEGHLVLTDKGREIAEKMYERHKLLSRWLIFMGVSEETAMEDACRMEHVISVETFDAMKKHFALFHGILPESEEPERPESDSGESDHTR